MGSTLPFILLYDVIILSLPTPEGNYSRYQLNFVKGYFVLRIFHSVPLIIESVFTGWLG